MVSGCVCNGYFQFKIIQRKFYWGKSFVVLLNQFNTNAFDGLFRWFYTPFHLFVHCIRKFYPVSSALNYNTRIYPTANKIHNIF